MRITTCVLPTDERPDHEDLSPFFERPAAIRLEGSEDLALFRISCEYRLAAFSERTEIRLAAFMFARLDDGRLELVAFRLTRPRGSHAYDEAALAFAAIRTHAASLPDDEAHKARLASGAGYLLDRWRREEAILRRLLTPPF
jgi:hypothetical protein